MKRHLWIVLCVLSLICLDARADENRQLKKIGEHVWAYTDISPKTLANGCGVNTGVIVGDKGALIVDTRSSAKEGKRFLADIRKITKLPILWVVNTHYHFDHAWGNCVFVDEGAKVIGASPAPELLAKSGPRNLAQYQKNDKTREDFEGTTIVPATVSFTGTMTLDLGGIVVELRSLPHAHSPDNLMVWVPQDKVLFSGDLLFVGCHPFLGEGDIQGWITGLDTIASFKAEKIVPGHGPVSTAKDIEEMKAYLKAFDDNAKELAKGKTKNDAPALAKELEKRLPDQGRKELSGMIEHNLRMKYLPRKKTSSK